jgi:hypothetical protein
LFVERLFTIVSISLHVMGLFLWLISSWFNFGLLYASKNLLSSSRFSS